MEPQDVLICGRADIGKAVVSRTLDGSAILEVQLR
jgi:hypothetical protein